MSAPSLPQAGTQSPAQPTSAPTVLTPPSTATVPTVQGPSCHKTVTFAVAANGGLVYRLPHSSAKWFEKTEKKFAGLCFSQFGVRSNPADEQYLVVLSTSKAAFNGLQPLFRTYTNMDTSLVPSSGTVTDVRGAWDYTYRETATTTTTMTTQENVPHTDTTTTLYANAYNEAGDLVGAAQRSVTVRQGRALGNAAGHNLGVSLSPIDIKEHLLEDITKQVNALH